MSMLIALLYWLLLTCSVAGVVYIGVAIWAVRRFTSTSGKSLSCNEPVSLLKPLCGLEPGLYDNLRSFCEQDYPAYQVIFGVRDPTDPAVAVVRRLMVDLPGQDLALVIEPTVVGTNLKVSNLAHMQTVAKYPILIVADADMRVDRSYLRAVTTPFADHRIGAATCLYKGEPLADGVVNTWVSRLAALFINDYFLPSVLVALSFEKLEYCFGATMGVRTAVLEQLGGFASLASDLADDHLLGKRVSALGYGVALVPYVVENRVYEPDLRSLILHELRWARTIKSVRPGGYVGSFVTYAIATSLVFWFLSGWNAAGLLLTAAAVFMRVLLHKTLIRDLNIGGPNTYWLLAGRDILCFLIWAASFCGSRVHWKANRFNLESDGQLIHEGKHSL